MLAKATELAPVPLPAAAGSAGGRFAREPGEYQMRGGAQLTLIRGGAAEPETTP
jgi:hypothetical protein